MRVRSNLSMILLLALFTVVGSLDATAQRGPRGRDGGPDRGTPGRAVPSVDAMADVIDADATQRAALAEARLELIESIAERAKEERPRGRRGGHDGPRTRPFMSFLVDVAPVMDTGDMIALVDLFGDQRGARAMGRRDGRPDGRHGDGPRADGPRGRRGGSAEGPRGGRHDGPRHEDGLVQQLDLTETQRDAVDALYATTMGALQALRRQVGPGEEPTQAQRDEAARIRADHQERLRAILTDEQNTALLGLRAERMATRSEEGATRRATRREQRLAELTAILDLDARQVEAVEAALDSAEEEAMRARGERMSKGGPMPHLFDVDRGRDLRQSTRDAITAVLEPQQRELFARLQTLALENRGHGRRGHR